MFFFFFNTQKVHKLPPGKQFLLKMLSSAILPTYPYYLCCQLNVLVIPKKIKPVIVGSAEEEPFEAKEVYAQDYNPSVDTEEDEDETDEKPQLVRGVSRSFKTVTILFFCRILKTARIIKFVLTQSPNT